MTDAQIEEAAHKWWDKSLHRERETLILPGPTNGFMAGAKWAREEAARKVEAFYFKISHGDEKHQEWLETETKKLAKEIRGSE